MLWRAPLTALAVIAAVCALALVLAPSARTAPVADIAVDFDWSPAAPTAGQPITFTARVTPPDGVKLKQLNWDLSGDGKVESYGQAPSWTYPAPTTVTVRLQARGNGNHRGDATHTISVAAAPGDTRQAPIASFTSSPSRPTAGEPVLFTSHSSDPDGTIAEQVWDLNGDASFDNGGGATALRTFPEPGEYVVGLRVTDNDGLVSYDSRTVQVSPGAGTSFGSSGGVPATAQKTGPRLLSPFPIVRIAGRITRTGTRVRLLLVSAPPGSTISVRCQGRRCPFKKQVRRTSPGLQSRTSVSLRVRRLERFLLPGVRVRVFITKDGAIGKYTKFRFRGGKAPARTDRCLMPGSWAPAQCPA
jgi:PKD domain-containing protein